MPPSLDFPRDDEVKPERVSGIFVPGALRQRAQGGQVNLRSVTDVGRTWSESYPPLKAGNPTIENFLAFLRRTWNRGLAFNIKHQRTPGSGMAPNGTGTSGVTVSGTSQSGDTITTTGWPVSTTVCKAGDMVRIAGVGSSLEIYQNVDSDGSGNADLKINPPIFVGNEPADGASVTTTDVDIYATYLTQPNIPRTARGFYYEGFELQFIEVPNA